MRVYINALEKEIEERSCDGIFDSVYIGGGTPSVLYRGAISRILAALYRSYDIVRPEITVECNPDSASEAFFDECVSAGVNRFSIGLQTTDDALLACIGRAHDYGTFLKAYNNAVKYGSVNVDLMMGLPGQSVGDVALSVKTVCDLAPQHVSLYALKCEEGTPLYNRGYCPDEDLQAAMYDAAFDSLTGRGYCRYEVSNFALKGFESRHNLKYWTMKPYLGFGASAHSFTGDCRMANVNSIEQYVTGKPPAVIRETERDFKEEYVMLALRTAAGIDLSDYERRFNVSLIKEKSKELERLVRGGIVLISDGSLRLADGAFYVMNSVIAELV